MPPCRPGCWAPRSHHDPCRGKDALSASGVEQEWAQTHGVNLRLWAAPQQVLVQDMQGDRHPHGLHAVADGKLQVGPEVFDVPADMVLKAIGQTYVSAHAGSAIALRDGRIDTDAEGQTSVPRCRVGRWRLPRRRPGSDGGSRGARQSGRACHAPGADQRRGCQRV